MKGWELCEHLGGMCHGECLFADEEGVCPQYWPQGRLKLQYIGVDLIDPRAGNRDIGDVTELADSIRAEGMHSPVTVCPHAKGVPGRYTAVAGHRRLAAAKLAGLKEVPCIVRELDEAEQITMMISENVQRKDMTPLEQAEAIGQLMLVLPKGTTAADVAKRTGLSETTVRRRRKLAELPRELVQQADERGATLEDYEKLNAIKDPERKKKVLAAVGTAEFGRELQNQKREEEQDAAVERLTGSLKKKGARQISQAEAAVRKDLSNEQTIYSWNLQNASIKGLDRDQEWLYVVNGREIRVYRVVKNDTPEEKTDAEKAREELKALDDDLREELTAQRGELDLTAQEFLDLREDFIEKFTLYDRHREEIMEVAVMALIGCVYWSPDRLKELQGWLGIENVEDPDELARCIRQNPERALLRTAYCALERYATGWRETNYYNGISYYRHKESADMDKLYDGLRVLGYPVSAEELHHRDGSVPQYAIAERLIAEHKKQKRELDKRIKA